jgi:hypothetical protein
MSENEELPAICWRTNLSPTMDRREQLIRYQDAVGVEATKRQVQLHREAQPPRKREAN